MSGAAAKLLLNIGSGPTGGRLPAVFDDWRQLRVDIDPAAQPDILADLLDLRSIRAGMADAVWTSHCLEHVYEHHIQVALGEISRIMRPDGFACILVPDLQRVAEVIADDRMHEALYNSPSGPITAHDVVFGHGPAIAQGHLYMAHRSGFTPTILMRHLSQAGFGGFAILRRANYELAAVVRKKDWGTPRERDELIAALGL